MLRFTLISGLKKVVDKNRLQVNLLDIADHTLFHLACSVTGHSLIAARRSLAAAKLSFLSCFAFFFKLTKAIFYGFWQLGNIVHSPPVGLNAAFVLFAVRIQDVLSPL